MDHQLASRTLKKDTYWELGCVFTSLSPTAHGLSLVPSGLHIPHTMLISRFLCLLGRANVNDKINKTK